MAAGGAQRIDEPQVGALVVRVALEDAQVVARCARSASPVSAAAEARARAMPMYVAWASSRVVTAQSS